MPKSSATVPNIQPSINRLTLTAQPVRGGGSPSGDQTGFCCGLLCTEAEVSNAETCSIYTCFGDDSV